MIEVVKVGSEFLVNTQTASNQFEATIIGLANGNFVVSWYDTSLTLGDISGSSIKAQVFDASGNKLSTEFHVNTQTADFQSDPTITGLANGGFVIGWRDFSNTLGDTSGSSIKAQVFDANGNKLGTEFLVNTETSNHQADPTITGLANGNFVVSWTDASLTLGDTSNTSIKAQIFDATGNKLGTEFLINTQTTNSQSEANITVLANGGFVVSWDDRSNTLGDTSRTGIKAQIYDESGNKLGTEFLVNTQVANFQSDPTITGLTNGNFVVSWTDESGTLGDVDGTSIKAQVFDASGNKLGTELLVNTQTSGFQFYQTITGLANGNFVVSWHDESGTLGDGFGSSIKAQVFDASGNKLGTEFIVNTTAVGNQTEPNISGLANGNFVVSWRDDSGTLGDSSGFSIKAQIFSVQSGNSAPSITTNGGGDTATISVAENSLVVTTVVADDLDGDVRTYAIAGGADADFFQMDATTGALTFKTAPNFEAPGDANQDNVYDVVVRASDGTLFDEQMLAVSITDVLDTGTYTGTAANNVYGAPNAFDWTISGDAGDDRLTGGAGDDTIYGGDDNDRLDGGFGNDIVFGDAGDDVFVEDDSNDLNTTHNFLFGGEGNDLFLKSGGGFGSDRVIDTLSGGSGRDTFTIDGYDPRFTTSVDVIIDFETGSDGDQLNLTYLSNTLSGWDRSVNPFTSGYIRIVQSGNNSLIEVDQNGGNDNYRTIIELENTSASSFTIHNFTPVSDGNPDGVYGWSPNDVGLTLVGSDLSETLIGSDSKDNISGNGGNDILRGFGGDDTFYGGDGNDQLDGGFGNDTAIFRGARSDYVAIDLGGGNYRFTDSRTNAPDGSDTLTNIEFAQFADGTVSVASLFGVTIIGTAANDIINPSRALPGQPKATALDDKIFGNGGNDTIDGGAGADQMHGGTGNDTFVIDNVDDQIIELAGQDTDTMKSSVVDLTLAANVEKGLVTGLLDLDITGNELANTLTGNARANVLRGGEGKDILNGNDGQDSLFGDGGNDTLNGGNGNDSLSGGAGIDLLTGGSGSDILTGGSEADQFKFDKFMLADGLSATDTITDFSGIGGDRDRINLSAIDANGNAGDGNQKFGFIGAAAFGGVAGQLRYEQVGGVTRVLGDTDGDGVADFQIDAIGTINFTSGDFIL